MDLPRSAPLVIPTRNRPTSLSGVLRYVGRHYPGTRVLIADGSSPTYDHLYREVIEAASHDLDLDYRRYDPMMPVGERLIEAVQSIDDDIIIVGADDDFPVLDTLSRGVDYLRAHDDYVLAIGGIIMLKLADDGGLSASLLQARAVRQGSAGARISHFIQWPYATSYAAVRRAHYLARCENVDLNAMTGFGDYNVAFHDCLAGKIHAMPEIGYFTTKLPIHSKIGNKAPLFYLRDAKEILALRDYYQTTLLANLSVTEDYAEKLANRMIAARVAYYAGGAPQRKKGFARTDLFREDVVRRQYTAFRDLFRKGTKSQQRLGPQLRSIVDEMQRVVTSGIDNAGEPALYASLAEMSAPTAS